jgi:hypothetical protein
MAVESKHRQDLLMKRPAGLQPADSKSFKGWLRVESMLDESILMDEGTASWS